jgi:hypothetical protein
MPRHSRPQRHAELFIGRSAALFVHPFAAWRSPSRSDRGVLLISYFAISYVMVLALLHVLSMVVS